MGIIESIFGSGTQTKLLKFLYTHDNEFHANGLAKAAGVPLGSIHKSMHALVAKQLVVASPGMFGPMYRAPTEDPRLRPLFQLFRQESVIVDDLTREFKKLKTIRYAGVFGSFASGNTHRNSDIDVLILEDASDYFAISSALARIESKHGFKVHAQYYSVAEFMKNLAAGCTVINDILDHPVIDIKSGPLGTFIDRQRGFAGRRTEYPAP